MKKNITHNILYVTFSAIVLFLFSTMSVLAASLSLSPAAGSFFVGDNVAVRVVVSSPNKDINAVSGILTFPSDKFQVVSLSKNSSIINFWATDPTFSNSSGKINFEGIVFNPGFQGSGGSVLTVLMKAKSAGNASLTFSSGSVLANDGQGTDVTSGLTGGNFSIKVAKVPPVTTPPKEVSTSTETVVEVETAPVATLASAEILLGSKYGAPAVIGISGYSKAKVLLTFVALDGTKIFITGTSEENGDFSFLIPKTLKHGLYKVTAVLVKDDGKYSVPSNEISIQVGNIFSDVGWQIWLMIILLFALIIYLSLRIIFHIQKKIRPSNKVKVGYTENILHKSFDTLREDLSKHKDDSDFKKDIDDVEKEIDKDVKDLET